MATAFAARRPAAVVGSGWNSRFGSRDRGDCGCPRHAGRAATRHFDAWHTDFRFATQRRPLSSSGAGDYFLLTGRLCGGHRVPNPPSPASASCRIEQDRERILEAERTRKGRLMNLMRLHTWRSCVLWIAASWAGSVSQAADHIAFTDAREREQKVTGEILVEARDGGVLLLGDDGRIWTIQPDRIQHRTNDDAPFRPASVEETQRRLLAEMPAGFRIYQTNHYLICHNTSDRYATWVGALFEQLYRGFYAYWKNQGWELEEPRFPLVGLVFADRESFVRYAQPELGDSVKGIIGYYNLETNRMTTYDMPNAERKVATIIHEATHQLAYNAGLQKRFADNPMWVSEGLAVFFEAPDFTSPRGWRSIGRINRVNFQRFARYLRSRPADSLTTLLSDDSRFRRGATATDAYAEAWALNYFLLKTREEEYVDYLQRLSEGERLGTASPRERIAVFEEAIGMSLEELERRFLPFMMRLR